MVVPIYERDFHLKLFPHPAVKDISIVGGQSPAPRILVSKALSPFAKNKYRLFQILALLDAKKFGQFVRTVKSHDGRLQQIFPPNPLGGLCRERPRIDHFFHDVIFEGWGVKTNQ